MKLYKEFPQKIIVDGAEYSLSLWFDRVLNYIDLCESGDFSGAELTDIGYDWFVTSPKKIPAQIKARVLDAVFKEIINPPKRMLKNRGKPLRVMDFSYDAAAIYASFMYAYGIDLEQERGRMHWQKFIALLDGLPEDAPIMRIIGIRTREIPAPNKHNMKQIQRLSELKALYALPPKNGEETDSADGWNRLFDILKSKAR